MHTRRDHADRWCVALQNTADPRVTQKLRNDRLELQGAHATSY